MSKKHLLVLACAVCVAFFQNDAAAQSQSTNYQTEAEQNENELAPNINLLQGEQESDTDAVSIDVSRLSANGEATAATYEKRQILFQRLVKANTQGSMEGDPEDIVMTLSDTAIEDIFAGYGEGEDQEIDLDMVAEIAGTYEQQSEEQEELDEEVESDEEE